MIVTPLVVALLALSCPQPAMAAGQAPGVKNEHDFQLSCLFAVSKFTAGPDEVACSAVAFVLGVIDSDLFREQLNKPTPCKLKDHTIRVVKTA